MTIILKGNKPLPARPAKHKPRQPTATLAELAVEFGITKKQIGGYFMQVKPPEPHIVTAKGLRYYDVKLMREWWSKVEKIRGEHTKNNNFMAEVLRHKKEIPCQEGKK